MLAIRRNRSSSAQGDKKQSERRMDSWMLTLGDTHGTVTTTLALFNAETHDGTKRNGGTKTESEELTDSLCAQRHKLALGKTWG